jgi:hypothetical protein
MKRFLQFVAAVLPAFTVADFTWNEVETLWNEGFGSFSLPRLHDISARPLQKQSVYVHMYMYMRNRSNNIFTTVIYLFIFTAKIDNN